MIQDGIDKAIGSSLIQRRNLNEQNRNRTIGLSDSRQIEAAEQRNEIRHLHEKIDHLLRRQYNRLFEIQQIQIELLEEISRQKK